MTSRRRAPEPGRAPGPTVDRARLSRSLAALASGLLGASLLGASLLGASLLGASLLGCGPSGSDQTDIILVDDPNPVDSLTPGDSLTPAEVISRVENRVSAYVEGYLEHYPTTATGAGRSDLDSRLEDFSAPRLARWTELNRQTLDALDALLRGPLDRASTAPGTPEDGARLDAQAVARQARRELFLLEELDRHGTDPLYWTGLLATTPVFLLVRDDRPLADRLASLDARLDAVPRLVDQARSALRDPARIHDQHASMAAQRARATASFLRRGPALAAEGLASRGGGSADRETLRARLSRSSERAATAIETLADHLEALAEKATGSPRLGEHYARSFALGTGSTEPVASVLARAEAALIEKRAEAAQYCRSIWSEHLAPRPMPGPEPAEAEGTVETDSGPEADDPRHARDQLDARVVRACFERIAEDRISELDEQGVERFVEQYQRLTRQALDFVAERELVTLPGEFTLVVDRSPPFFAGQAVGGVYPAGPFAPHADTFLFVPTPPATASAEARAGFYRDFNDHFNLMITPHETVPGHYLQLKTAALQPTRARTLFDDGVYTEGWGTFCERSMLDLGWGGPLARVAHLKKQLENIARTIVDIRVHTGDMDREEVLRFVRDEALQDEQFAANMWVRAITSSPQITTYFLGYTEIWALYQDVLEARGDDFDLRTFLDQMLALGPVPVSEYRRVLLAPEAAR